MVKHLTSHTHIQNTLNHMKNEEAQVEACVRQTGCRNERLSACFSEHGECFKCVCRQCV